MTFHCHLVILPPLQVEDLSRKFGQRMLLSKGLGRAKRNVRDDRLLAFEQLCGFLMIGTPSRLPQGGSCQRDGMKTMLCGACWVTLLLFFFQ